MSDTNTNNVTAQEIIEAAATMSPRQLHHWCSRKRVTGVACKYNNNILWDLKLEAMEVCAANYTWLEKSKDPSGKPGPHKVRGQEMFELFLIFQEVFNSQQKLPKEQMEYLQTWTDTIESLLEDSVHHLWSDTAGVIDIESVYDTLLDTCTKAMQSITPESKRIWWDILEVLESIAGMACINTHLTINLLRTCSRMLLKH
jgi:hypothetical protein